jgi:hypothetical protein
MGNRISNRAYNGDAVVVYNKHVIEKSYVFCEVHRVSEHADPLPSFVIRDSSGLQSETRI